MKHSRRCPNCAHNEILYLPYLPDTGQGGSGALSGYVEITGWMGQVTTRGTLTAYVCKNCGLTELYMESPDSIPVEKIPGAKVLVGGATAPYR